MDSTLSVRRSAVLLTMVLGGCAARGLPLERTPFAPALGVNLAASTRLPAGLYYRDIVVGTGAQVTNGKLLQVLYTGWLSDGTQFDSNVGGTPIQFRVNAGQVVAGWDRGVLGMRVGGRRQLVVPPHLGYGPEGRGPIPRNATLVFTIEVIAAN